MGAGTTYYLVPGGEQKDTDYDWDNYCQLAEFSLEEQGFTRVGDTVAADLVIYFSYDLGEGEEYEYTYSVPVYGQTGYSSSTTSGSVYGNTYQGTTTYQPAYGVVGATTHLATGVVYPRSARLGAYPKSELGKESPQESWYTFIYSGGSSNDLRKVMPFMFCAARGLFAKDTEGWVKSEITMPYSEKMKAFSAAFEEFLIRRGYKEPEEEETAQS